MSQLVKTILIIPDLHCPYAHPDAHRFLQALKVKHSPQKIICLGDEIDGHAWSFHDKDPDLFSPGQELQKAKDQLAQLYTIFPRMDILESNHGSLIYRKQKYHGLPRDVFKSYNEILEAPREWRWHSELTLRTAEGNVCFRHSFCKNSARAAQLSGSSIVQAHYHSEFNIHYITHGDGHNWGMSCGCLIDFDSMAFAYAKANLPRPKLGAAIIVNGHPQLISMCVKSYKGKMRWTGKL